jgi:hypothetical protein
MMKKLILTVLLTQALIGCEFHVGTIDDAGDMESDSVAPNDTDTGDTENDTESETADTEDTESETADTEDTESETADTEDTESETADTEDTESETADTEDTESESGDTDDTDSGLISTDSSLCTEALLTGTWVISTTDNDGVPYTATYVFADDGTYSFTLESGVLSDRYDATYEILDDTLVSTIVQEADSANTVTQKTEMCALVDGQLFIDGILVKSGDSSDSADGLWQYFYESLSNTEYADDSTYATSDQATETITADGQGYEYDINELGSTQQDDEVIDGYEYQLQSEGTLRIDNDLVYLTPETLVSSDPDDMRGLVIDEELFVGFLLSYDVMVPGSDPAEDKYATGFVKQD